MTVGAVTAASVGLRLTPVTNLLAYAKRVLIGRPMRSDAMGHQLLPKRIALPIFASDALSSVAYAPDETAANAYASLMFA